MTNFSETDSKDNLRVNIGRVAVIGGGIGGLAAAHWLAKAGAQVVVYEASDQLGGLGTFFQYRDVHLERFYHCMLPSDKHLLGILQELDLVDQIYWKETSFGFMSNGRLYGLNTPLELLQFSRLSWIDRIRVGITGLWGSICSSDGLDDVTCVEWLSKLSGRRAFETFWKPMLQAKFGDRYHDVPALWFWTRFNREKGGKKECKGYIHGGYRRIIDTLVKSIETHGGIIRLRAPVQKLDLTENGQLVISTNQIENEFFDRIVVTAPIFFLQNALKEGNLANVAKKVDAGIDMQGVINAVFMLRRGFTKHYWVAAIDDDIPFQGVVESTTLLDKSDTGGVHLIYLMNYLHRTDPRFLQSDDVIIRSYINGLGRLFPDFKEDDIVDSFVFRAPFVEPLYTTGFQRRKPPIVLLPEKLYLATATQVYPDVTSWNGAVGLAKRVVNELFNQVNTTQLK